MSPITSTMIKDWAFVEGLMPTPFEVRAIKAVDKAYRIHSQTQSKKEEPT